MKLLIKFFFFIVFSSFMILTKGVDDVYSVYYDLFIIIYYQIKNVKLIIIFENVEVFTLLS